MTMHMQCTKCGTYLDCMDIKPHKCIAKLKEEMKTHKLIITFDLLTDNKDSIPDSLILNEVYAIIRKFSGNNFLVRNHEIRLESN